MPKWKHIFGGTSYGCGLIGNFERERENEQDSSIQTPEPVQLDLSLFFVDKPGRFLVENYAVRRAWFCLSSKFLITKKLLVNIIFGQSFSDRSLISELDLHRDFWLKKEEEEKNNAMQIRRTDSSQPVGKLNWINLRVDQLTDRRLRVEADAYREKRNQFGDQFGGPSLWSVGGLQTTETDFLGRTLLNKKFLSTCDSKSLNQSEFDPDSWITNCDTE